MSKPTHTINPLHFEDLDPRRFEDLALALVYRLRTWEDIHHDGRTGTDDGVDIRAIEKAVDGSLSIGPFSASATALSALRMSKPPSMRHLPRHLLRPMFYCLCSVAM